MTTPAGLLAIGGMVTLILLGSSAIVLAARDAKRRAGLGDSMRGPTPSAALPAIEAR